MNYKKTLLLVFIFLQSHAEKKDVQISAFCELINERIYFTQRLEKTITFLRSMHLQAPDVSIDLSLFQSEDSRIQEIAQSITDLKSLHIIFATWKNIQRYKKIKDSIFVRELEFCKQISISQ